VEIEEINDLGDLDRRMSNLRFVKEQAQSQLRELARRRDVLIQEGQVPEEAQTIHAGEIESEEAVHCADVPVQAEPLTLQRDAMPCWGRFGKFWRRR